MKKGSNEEIEELEVQLKQAVNAVNLAREEGKLFICIYRITQNL